MTNMTYCRFQNTLNALDDNVKHGLIAALEYFTCSCKPKPYEEIRCHHHALP